MRQWFVNMRGGWLVGLQSATIIGSSNQYVRVERLHLYSLSAMLLPWLSVGGHVRDVAMWKVPCSNSWIFPVHKDAKDDEIFQSHSQIANVKQQPVTNPPKTTITSSFASTVHIHTYITFIYLFFIYVWCKTKKICKWEKLQLEHLVFVLVK